MDKISPNDLQLFHDAQTALQAAQATLQFVSGHLTRVYGLTDAARVDIQTGVITRPFEGPVDPPTDVPVDYQWDAPWPDPGLDPRNPE